MRQSEPMQQFIVVYFDVVQATDRDEAQERMIERARDPGSLYHYGAIPYEGRVDLAHLELFDRLEAGIPMAPAVGH